MNKNKTTISYWTDALEDLGACGEAVQWAQDYDSLDAAWAACERGDWMLWLLARVAQQGSREHKAAVATACACARRALWFVQPSELQPPLHAIELAERWAQGDPTVSLADLRQARRAASAAADAAYAAAAAADAAYAAAAAAAAAYAAAYAATAAAAAAAYAAAYAAAAAAAKAERTAIADLIRERHVAPVLRWLREPSAMGA